MNGLGNGIVYIPGLIACGFYFDEHKRALATGLATSGNGIGVILIPIFMSCINDEFGWRSAMLFLSVISPIICLFSLVMIPLSMLSTNIPETNSAKSIASLESGDGNNNDLASEKEKLLSKHQDKIPDSVSNYPTTPGFLQQITDYVTESWNLLKQPSLGLKKLEEQKVPHIYEDTLPTYMYHPLRIDTKYYQHYSKLDSLGLG